MATIARSVEIDRPAAAVWALLEDVRRLPEFSPSTVEVTRAPERLTRRGQRFRQVVRAVGRCFESEWEVVDLQPGRLLSIEGSVGFGVRYRLTQRVDAVGPERARLSLTVDYTLPFGPLGRVAARLGVDRLAAAEADQVLAGVERVLEGDRLAAAP